uniref:Uncharacterized protein n=1 Tax=Siphoviridae sp. ctKcB20 TaxID=2827568 RepID=A0A8S5LLA2_9CAUD|nr:MAG TPA: hypothetical protein [Siphoviridae sp. ctKcB20]
MRRHSKPTTPQTEKTYKHSRTCQKACSKALND